MSVSRIARSVRKRFIDPPQRMGSTRDVAYNTLRGGLCQSFIDETQPRGMKRRQSVIGRSRLCVELAPLLPERQRSLLYCWTIPAKRVRDIHLNWKATRPVQLFAIHPM